MLAWLIACAPGSLSAEEAAVVYEGVSGVNADVYAAVYAFSAPDGDEAGLSDASAKSLTWHTAADGGDYSGSVEGPGSWSGTVELTGGYTVELIDRESWGAVWSMDATYVDVRYGDMRLDGAVAWKLGAEADGSNFEHTSMVEGDIVAGGSVTGAGALGYTTTVVLRGGRYTVSTEGEVGGHDISTAYDATAFGL